VAVLLGGRTRFLVCSSSSCCSAAAAAGASAAEAEAAARRGEVAKEAGGILCRPHPFEHPVRAPSWKGRHGEAATWCDRWAGNTIFSLGVFFFMLGTTVGWCRPREKIDWQEACKFDCRLVRTIFIFCCPSSIFT